MLVVDFLSILFDIESHYTVSLLTFLFIALRNPTILNALNVFVVKFQFVNIARKKNHEIVKCKMKMSTK